MPTHNAHEKHPKPVTGVTPTFLFHALSTTLTRCLAWHRLDFDIGQLPSSSFEHTDQLQSTNHMFKSSRRWSPSASTQNFKVGMANT